MFDPNDSPLVSCQCITKVGRLKNLEWAIESYLLQDWPNKELIIITENWGYLDDICAKYESKIGVANRIFVHSGTQRSLGLLRQEALTLTGARYICQWDDDDVYHRSRITQQMRGLVPGSPINLLQFQIHLFVKSFRAVEGFLRFSDNGIPGTALYDADLLAGYGIKYSDVSRAEDTQLISDIIMAGLPVSRTGSVALYCRIYHGNNTWDEDHHRRVSQGDIFGGTSDQHEFLLDHRLEIINAFREMRIKFGEDNPLILRYGLAAMKIATDPGIKETIGQVFDNHLG